MPQFKTSEQLTRMKQAELAVEQTLISQDLAFSIEQINQNINQINNLRMGEVFAQRQNSPVPQLNRDLITITDTFTQAVCNTYRVEIKTLFTPLMSQVEQPKK